MAGEEGPVLGAFVVVSSANEAELDDLGVELDELEDVEVGRVRVQVIQDLLGGGEAHVVPLSPREIRELIVATRGLEFS